VLCAEYCGDLHSQMLAKLVVMSESAHAKWLEEKKAANQNMPLPELGKNNYEKKLGCIACHTVDGTHRIGPTFKDLYGKTEELTNGTKVEINEKYIREKILHPTKTVAKGFAPVMPSFQGRVSERDILGLISFIKSVSGVKEEPEKAPAPAE
jgi:cytochrome c oxidase subunit II